MINDDTPYDNKKHLSATLWQQNKFYCIVWQSWYKRLHSHDRQLTKKLKPKENSNLVITKIPTTIAIDHEYIKTTVYSIINYNYKIEKSNTSKLIEDNNKSQNKAPQEFR